MFFVVEIYDWISESSVGWAKWIKKNMLQVSFVKARAGACLYDTYVFRFRPKFNLENNWLYILPESSDQTNTACHQCRPCCFSHNPIYLKDYLITDRIFFAYIILPFVVSFSTLLDGGPILRVAKMKIFTYLSLCVIESIEWYIECVDVLLYRTLCQAYICTYSRNEYITLTVKRAKRSVVVLYSTWNVPIASVQKI